jgi:hypothetical protein
VKTVLCIAGLIAGMIQGLLAGGNTSVVQLAKVTSIVIEDQRIVFRGHGMVMARVITDQEHGDASVFGGPAQMLHARVEDGEFEVRPYFAEAVDASSKLSGVSEEERKEYFEKGQKWWKETVAKVREMKVGDAVTIGYQGDEMTLKGFRVVKIVGVGSITRKKKEE